MIQSTIRSSLPLEILLRIHLRFSIIFYLFIIGVFIYKLSLYPYVMHVGFCEAAIILLFGPIELIRIQWARRGNFTEKTTLLILSIILSFGATSTCIYLALFQAYLAKIEQIVVYIELGLLAVETILEIFAIISFK